MTTRNNPGLRRIASSLSKKPLRDCQGPQPLTFHRERRPVRCERKALRRKAFFARSAGRAIGASATWKSHSSGICHLSDIESGSHIPVGAAFYAYFRMRMRLRFPATAENSSTVPTPSRETAKIAVAVSAFCASVSPLTIPACAAPG